MIGMTWSRRFLALAEHIATWSKDPSTKVGAVIVNQDRQVVATGYNGFPRGVSDTPERLNDRPTKYELVVHAEANAILQAARHGVAIKGCTIYSTFPPCAVCAKSIIQAGLSKVVVPVQEHPERWVRDFEISRMLFDESGVTVVEVSR